MDAALLAAGLILVCFSDTPPLAAEAGDRTAVARGPVHATHEAWFEFDDQELRFRSVFELRSSGTLSSVRFSLPEDVRIDHVEAPNLAGYEVDANAYELDVSLVARPGGREMVTVVGHVPFDPEIALDAVLLPVLEPQDVERETGRLHLFAPHSTNLVVDRDIALGAAPTVAHPQAPSSDMRHVASWSYRRRPVELLVEMSREPLRMTARIATEARLHARYVELRSRIDYRIESGQTDAFQIALPPAVADQVRIEALDGATIAQTTRGEETADGWVPWTVITREPVTDRVSFAVHWELGATAVEQPDERIVLISHIEREPSPGGRRTNDRERHVILEPVRAFETTTGEEQRTSLRRVTGLLTVHAPCEFAVAISPIAGDSEPVSRDSIERRIPSAAEPAEFEPRDGGGLVCVSACRYEDWPVAWKLMWRKSRPPGPAIVISHSLVEIAIHPGALGESWANYRCRYRVRMREREQLLLEIPAGRDDRDLRVVGVFHNGRAISLEPAGEAVGTGWKRFLLPVGGNPADSDEALSLTLFFELRVGVAPFRGFGSRLELPLPRIGGRGAIVYDLQTAVRVPRKYAIVGTPAGFEDVSGAPGESDRFDDWSGVASAEPVAFEPARRRYIFRRTGNDDAIIVSWWNVSLATCVLSAAVFLMALVLRPTSWRNRLNVVVFLGFAVAMAAVAVPEVVREGLVASRAGLVAGVLLWACGSLPGRTGRCHAP